MLKEFIMVFECKLNQPEDLAYKKESEKNEQKNIGFILDLTASVASCAFVWKTA
jgi:hypothetical protein